MYAIARALTSLGNLTGLAFFHDLAKPFDQINRAKIELKNKVSHTQSKMASTAEDIKRAANQNKAS